MFVVKGLKTNLLGLPTIIALKMVSRVNEISDYNLDIPKKFPKVFQGLGTMGEPYSIKLKPDTQPRAIYAPRFQNNKEESFWLDYLSVDA